MTNDLSVIQAAASGERGEDQQRIAEQGLAFVSLILRKNTDYGSSAWRVPALAPGLDPGTAILVRASDKVERIGQLTQRPPEVADEPLEDTVRDLGAYCLLWLARPAVTVPSQQLEQERQETKPAKRRQLPPKAAAAKRGNRLSDRCHEYLAGQAEPQTLLDIADAVGTTRASVYQAIRKDNRFRQVSRGKWATNED